MKKIFTLFIVALVTTGMNMSLLKAQATSDQFKISELDPYFGEYFAPFARAMAVSMSGGWTHTAKVHSTLGFDITMSASMAKVPTTDLTFNASALDLGAFSVAGTAPTISAKNTVSSPRIERTLESPVEGGDDVVFGFDGISGVGLNFGGMFAIQGAIGLPKGTELIVRLIPDISKTANNVLKEAGDISLLKTNMWGFGVKHDIKQWIPVIAKVPFLQISGMFTYSKFQTGFSGADFRISPEDLGADDNSGNPSQWDNQKFEIGMSSFTGNLLVGANIPVFQPYIGLGFNSAKFEGGFRGNYPVVDFLIDGTNYQYSVTEADVDPLIAEVKATNFNFQAGARLKLGFFVFHYTFTAQKYNMHTGGIAFTFR